MFCRAVFPPAWAQDLKWAAVGQSNQGIHNGRDLLACLPFARPAKTSFLFPVDDEDPRLRGVYVMDPEIVETMPIWEWKTLLELA